jgi:hypothetical protein
MVMMKKKIAVGMFLVLAIALALGFAQLYPGTIEEAAEVGCEGYGSEANEAEDENITWIKDQIEKWKENPEMQIGAYAVHKTQKTVVIWVYELTPENQQLHHKMIGGWEIIVAKSPQAIINGHNWKSSRIYRSCSCNDFHSIFNL